MRIESVYVSSPSGTEIVRNFYEANNMLRRAARKGHTVSFEVRLLPEDREFYVHELVARAHSTKNKKFLLKTLVVGRREFLEYISGDDRFTQDDASGNIPADSALQMKGFRGDTVVVEYSNKGSIALKPDTIIRLPHSVFSGLDMGPSASNLSGKIYKTAELHKVISARKTYEFDYSDSLLPPIDRYPVQWCSEDSGHFKKGQTYFTGHYEASVNLELVMECPHNSVYQRAPDGEVRIDRRLEVLLFAKEWVADEFAASQRSN